MIVDELKKSILNYALSGKMSEQKDTDTAVKDMMRSINSQKKKYKTRLNKYNDTINQNVPFDIPQTWQWIELKNISLDIYAGGDKPKVFSINKTDKCSVPVIANGETNDGIVGYTDSATETEMSLTVAGRGTIGFSQIRTEPFTPIVRLIVIKLPKEINYKYLQKVFELLIETGVGTGVKQLTVPMIVNKCIPLPPMEEQQRIVDKTEELFSKLDEIKPIEDELEILKLNFIEDMRKSIVFSALSGKLTKHYENEKIINYLEKIKTRDVEINTPFDIPNNWKWVYFGDIVDFKIGKTPPRADSSYWSDGRYNWISIADMNDGGYVNDTKEMVSQKAFENVFKGNITPKGTLIMSFKMSLGKCSILNINSFHHEGIISIFPKFESDIIKEYLFKALPFLVKYGDSKNAIKGKTLNSQSLDKLLIPLPPIEEQQRIVEKLERLLPLCADIERIVNYD